VERLPLHDGVQARRAGEEGQEVTTPAPTQQGELPLGSTLFQPVKQVVLALLVGGRQPSAWELLSEVETKTGLKGRWELPAVLEHLAEDKSLTLALRSYCGSVRASEDLAEALRGAGAPEMEIKSTIDSLLQQSRAYRGSAEFQDMVSFMGSFRDYAPFNNMLVRLQNPTCSFYATEPDWVKRFERKLKEDARPMLILAPMHPVMLVYDLDQTEGKPLPKEITEFAKFEGAWKSEWLARVVENARVHDRVRVGFKKLSSTNAGFATIAAGDGGWKMRIAIHDELDEASRFGVLCHELAHIHLGHLGSDKDHWWPSRSELNHRTIEIEAEATAFIVGLRFGLKGASARYVSRYLGDKPMTPSVSLDLVAKVAGRLERMTKEIMKPRREKKAGGLKASE
jgi:hypothetical protein